MVDYPKKHGSITTILSDPAALLSGTAKVRAIYDFGAEIRDVLRLELDLQFASSNKQGTVWAALTNTQPDAVTDAQLKALGALPCRTYAATPIRTPIFFFDFPDSIGITRPPYTGRYLVLKVDDANTDWATMVADPTVRLYRTHGAPLAAFFTTEP